MYAIHWLPTFGAGVLLALGAYLGYGRVFSAALGIPTWWVIGNTATATTVVSNGQELTASSPSLAWLCYINAAVLTLMLFIGFAEWYSDEREKNDRSSGVPDLAEVTGGGR